MKFFKSTLILFIFAYVLQLELTAASTIKLDVTLSDDSGLFEGYKRVVVSLYSGATKQAWGETHKNVLFRSGKSTLVLGNVVPFTSAILDIPNPVLGLKVDGVENSVTFNLYHVPYALHMPTLHDYSLTPELKSLYITENIGIRTETPAYPLDVNGDINTNSSVFTNKLSVSTTNSTYAVNVQGRLEVQGTANVLELLWAGNVMSATAPAPFNTGVIDASWIKGLGGGGGGGYTDNDVRDVVEDMVTQNIESGLDVTVALSAGFKRLNFELNDPTITLSGDVAGAQTMNNLSDITIATTYSTVVPINKGGTNASTSANARTNLGLGSFSPTTNGLEHTGDLHLNGTLFFSGNLTPWIVSDRRYKQNITQITNSLSLIKQINGVYYSYKTDEFPDQRFSKKRQVGVIAQDVEAVLPELISENKWGYKRVNYSQMMGVVIEAIKEQQEQIDALKKENEWLKSQLK